MKMKTLNLKIFRQQFNRVLNLKLFTAFILTAIFYILIYILCQNFLELKAYDFLSNLTASNKPSSQIVIVTIDDQSLNRIGRWPWKRSYYTDVFEYLEKYGKVKAMAFDSYIFSYSEDDRPFFNRIKNLDKLVLGSFYAKQKGFFNLNFENRVNKPFQQYNSLTIEDKRTKNLIQNSNYSSCSYSLPELVNKKILFGSVLTEPDSDGIIRKFEPVIRYNNYYYPALSLALYSKLNGSDKFTLTNDSLTLNTKKRLSIPLVSNKKSSYMYLKWYRNANQEFSPYKTYSAWKIINSFNQLKKGQRPLINPDEFKDKIVIFGATSTVLKDIKSTPLGRDYPGVYIQATAINNLVDNNFVKTSLMVNLLILLFTLIICFSIVILLPPLYSSITITLLSLLYFSVCYICYQNNLAINVITPSVFALSSMTIGYGVKYWLESTHKKQIESIMSKYISNKFMKDILNDKKNANLGGRRSDMTVLFADIRNFTTISENLEPEKVSSILNLYFSEMIPIITRNNGILNKFMGDALLAIFDIENGQQDHAYNAVKCACEMIEKVKQLQQKWIEEEKPKIEIGIGVNTGVAFIGNIGSEDRMEYTVIGDTVNIASRLESFNKLYNTKLLISEYTYERLKCCLDVIKISSVYIKGKSEPITIYEVIQLLDADKQKC